MSSSMSCPRCKKGMLKQFEEDVWGVDLRCLTCGWEHHLGRDYNTFLKEALAQAPARNNAS